MWCYMWTTYQIYVVLHVVNYPFNSKILCQEDWMDRPHYVKVCIVLHRINKRVQQKIVLSAWSNSDRNMNSGRWCYRWTTPVSQNCPYLGLNFHWYRRKVWRCIKDTMGNKITMKVKNGFLITYYCPRVTSH